MVTVCLILNIHSPKFVNIVSTSVILLNWNKSIHLKAHGVNLESCDAGQTEQKPQLTAGKILLYLQRSGNFIDHF